MFILQLSNSGTTPSVRMEPFHACQMQDGGWLLLFGTSTTFAGAIMFGGHDTITSIAAPADASIG